jgi:hypothetical protein
MNFTDLNELDRFIMQYTLNTEESRIASIAVYSAGLGFQFIYFFILMGLAYAHKLHTFFITKPSDNKRFWIHLLLLNVIFLNVFQLATYAETIADLDLYTANIWTVVFSWIANAIFDTGFIFLVLQFLSCALMVELDDRRKKIISWIVYVILSICFTCTFLTVCLYCTFSIGYIPNAAFIRYMFALYAAYPLYAITKIGTSLTFVVLALRVMYVLSRSNGKRGMKEKIFLIRAAIGNVLAILANLIFLVDSLVTGIAMPPKYVMLGIAIAYNIPGIVWIAFVIIVFFPPEWYSRLYTHKPIPDTPTPVSPSVDTEMKPVETPLELSSPNEEATV